VLLRGSFTYRDATLVSTSFSGGIVILSIFSGPSISHFQIADAQLSNKFREDLRYNYQKRVEKFFAPVETGLLVQKM
jgi:hypothetical protein